MTATPESKAAAPGALSHIRVLDLSRILAGPWCTQNLADMGAEVIKVERPGTGDDTRAWGPPWTRDGDDTRDSTYYAAANRGKQSLTLDISKPEGQRIARELAAQSDVVIENYKIGDLKRYGLDYDSLRALNPGLVYCSITGYGQDGPSASKPGYDFVFQAIGGLMSITGERDDLPGGGPQKAGIAIADVITGMYATIAILAALNYRSVSGRGQYIDMALLDCIVALGGNQVTGYFATGRAPHRYGNAHASLVPYQVFRVADGEIVVAVGNDDQWQRYCRAIERPDLAADARWAKVTGRIQGRDTLVPELARSMLARPAADWLERLETHGVPCGRINDYEQVFQDPQVRHRGLRVDIPRGTGSGGVVSTIASPLRLRDTPPRYDLPPPRLGDSTERVLGSLLGYGPEDIARLRGQGIV
ncbi:CaiB/BaiF CoA transferase family protein [Bordetella hinzii]|uniref:CoA-transferase family III protein n=1 Tax=Bordetella hinzii OH87 BAL007II TaxID=1331262 RepID=A0ABR4R7I2_9BORD|nr:CaiB/BaiF CoA-transferase family protein [Bordetella hinzii]AKQ54467.1 Succinyl-CoA:(R)-benzylsuccinate CoA-transferase subunit BbsF [Bordetella hinzii]KCB23680.1 CoA-transferase family III protein [Bordetella hinzii L60]KCB26453.1 CoA-transferase family III protein [Bordetella hinzii OH87 BAL007II]KCB33733.1 CoA-transferase family III protein [Bordetella hinzii CA90 BAL1384]KCB40937.1 CoA-transferase family III protein [Bordetella hinzii 5132]